MGKRALIIFVKNPEKGKVKTRLAKTIGDDKALEVYCQLLDHTRSVAQKTEADCFLFYSQTIAEDDNWSSDDFMKYVQKEGELGVKMEHAFETVLLQGYEQAMIIGSDCAELTSEIVENGFKLLTQNDVVIGPAEDGGYYLLGMKKLYREFFHAKQWSTESVCADTLKDIENLQLTYQLLPTLSDIDHEEDLAALKHIKK